MEDHALTEDQCDRLTAKVMDKLAEKASDQYGAMHAIDLNPSITAHHTLRHALVRAAYMLGALEMQQSERERCKDLVRRYMPAGWSAVYDAIADEGPNVRAKPAKLGLSE